MEEVTLASGLSGIIKPWTADDLKVFTTRKKMKQPGPAIEAALMRNAWVETLASGPYAFDGKPPWMTEVLSGDLTDAIRWARAITFGDYDTVFRCEETYCREPIPVSVPLAELKTKRYSKEALENFQGDNRFEWEFPVCKKAVVYGLRTGATMTRIDRLAKQHGRHLHVVLAGSVRSVDGVRSNDLVKFMGQLDANDMVALEEALDRHEGGYDDDIELVCEDCGLDQTQSLRMKPDFFRPSKQKTKTGDESSRKKSSSESPPESLPLGSVECHPSSDSHSSTG